MARGRPWISEENATIERTIREEASMDEIVASLPDRTFLAVEHQIRRLGLKVAHIGAPKENFLLRNPGGAYHRTRMA